MKYIAKQGVILEGGKPLFEGQKIELDEIPKFLLNKITMVEEKKSEPKRKAKSKEV